MSDQETQAGTIHRIADGGFEGVLQRLYAGRGREEVWGMLTESAGMAQWLAPGTVELRQGGAVKIAFVDSGITIDSKTLECVPGRVLAYSWGSDGEPQRPLRWTLEEVEGGTRLLLTVRIPAGEDPAKACAGFEGHLEMLAAALEGAPIRFPVDLYLRARAEYRKQLVDQGGAAALSSPQ